MFADKRLDRALEAAYMVFWSKVADLYPEATSGDLDPMSAAVLESTMRDAVEKWLRYNHK